MKNKFSRTTKKKNSQDELLAKRKLLLGDIEKAFDLGDSEVIVNKILDIVLVLSLNQARLNYVNSLINEYTYQKSIDICNSLVDIQFLTKKPFEELKSEYESDILNFVVNPPKIDAWASNKTTVVIAKPTEFVQNININDSFSLSSSIPGQNSQGNGKKNILSALKFSSLPKGHIGTISEINDVFEGNKSLIQKESINNKSNNKDSESFITDKRFIKSFSRTTTKKFGLEANKEKNEDEDLPKQFSIIESEDNSGPVDELELVKEKALRIYFKEKELELERRKKLEKERGDNISEDEKTKKKLQEDFIKNAVALDYDGKIINVKVNDTENINYITQPNFKIKDKEKIVNGVRKEIKPKEFKPEEKELVKQIQTRQNMKNKNIKPDKIKNNPTEISEDHEKTPSNIHYISIENTLLETKKSNRNYQPDPIEHYVIQPGVTIDFYGLRKTGGKFPKIEERLSHEDFLEKAKNRNPKTNQIVVDYLQKLDNAEDSQVEFKKLKEKEEKSEKSNNMPKMLINNLNDEFDNKLKALVNENILHSVVKNTPTNLKNLNEIKKKQKYNKVRAMRDFKFKDIHKIDDDEIRQAFNTPEKNVDFSIIFKGKKMPKNVHMDIEKEMGFMKKYPRERISKDILFISGKSKFNSKEKISKYKNAIK
jgi:hypothetical protein